MLLFVKTFVCSKSFLYLCIRGPRPTIWRVFIMIDMVTYEYVFYECELRFPDGKKKMLKRYSVETLLADIKRMHLECSAMVLERVNVKGNRATLLFSAVVCGLDLEG